MLEERLNYLFILSIKNVAIKSSFEEAIEEYAAKKCRGKSIVKLCQKLLNYFLTPWSRVSLEKLTGLQLVKKFPAFYGTRRFLTAITSSRHVSLS
jgi:hypothetical protein